MRKASNTSRVVWALLVGGAFLSITTMQLTSAAAKPPVGKGDAHTANTALTGRVP